MANLLYSIPNLPTLSTLIGIETNLKVIDIGANPIDGDPPYKEILKTGSVSLIGFEPHDEALGKLNQAKGPYETYLGYAIGDGKKHKLNICSSSGLTSLLKPNPVVTSRFHLFPSITTVIDIIDVQTVKLDDIAEVSGADFMKIDIQGAELMAFKHAKNCLRDISVIQTEVEFLPMYVNQPLFSDVDVFLRKQGFILHRFANLYSRVITPLLLNDDPYAEMDQLLWGDAIYIKDFTKPHLLSDQHLLAMCRVMHEIYHSLDLVLHLLKEYDSRKNTNVSDAYLAGLQAYEERATSS